MQSCPTLAQYARSSVLLRGSQCLWPQHEEGNACRETFCWLPLSYCLNKRILVLHGGLFNEDGVTLDDIRKVDRCREPPDSGIMCDILWSCLLYTSPSPRD